MPILFFMGARGFFSQNNCFRFYFYGCEGFSQNNCFCTLWPHSPLPWPPKKKWVANGSSNARGAGRMPTRLGRPQGASQRAQRLKISFSSDRVKFSLLGRTPKGAYSTRGRSRHLLETPFSEPLLRTLLRTLFYCRTHRRPPSQNPSENPFHRTLLRTLCCRTPP